MKTTSDTELENVNGGFVAEAFLVAGLTAAAGGLGFVAAGIINNWKEFKEGFQQGYNTF